MGDGTMLMNEDNNLIHIKDFLEANGYDWSFDIIDRETKQKRNAQIADFVNILNKDGNIDKSKLPILSLDSAFEQYPRAEEFALGALVTEKQFVLFETQNSNITSQHEDLSFMWQTFNMQRTK